MSTRRSATGAPMTSYSTSKQREQRERAQRMAAELREHSEVRRSLKNVAARLKTYAEGGGVGAPAADLQNGLAARVDAILSRKEGSS